jgi:hypothetical protein
MNSTPRTDAEPKLAYRDATFVQAVRADFARELERENAALRADLDALRAAALRFAAVAVLLSRTKTVLKPEEWVNWEQTCAELCAALDATKEETKP